MNSGDQRHKSGECDLNAYKSLNRVRVMSYNKLISYKQAALPPGGTNMPINIAIDGPVGAGKSSIADQVDERLNILHLDTGAMYRAFAWKALQEGVDLNDEAALEKLTKTVLPERIDADFRLHHSITRGY